MSYFLFKLLSRKLLQILTVTLLAFSCVGSQRILNLGHRAGGDCFKEIPENTVTCLEKSCPIQKNRNFLYVEIDVRETADHEIVVFHDQSLKRMMKNGSTRHQIRRLRLNQIQSFQFKSPAEDKIPTLREFIDAAIEMEIKKPLVIEIKEIHSQEGLEKLIADVSHYKAAYCDHAEIGYERNYDFPKEPVLLMCFRWNLPAQMKHRPDYWKGRLGDAGIVGVYETLNHSVKLL